MELNCLIGVHIATRVHRLSVTSSVGCLGTEPIDSSIRGKESGGRLSGVGKQSLPLAVPLGSVFHTISGYA